MKRSFPIFFLGVIIIFTLMLPIMINASSNQDNLVSTKIVSNESNLINHTTAITFTPVTTVFLPITWKEYPPAPTISNISYFLVERGSFSCSNGGDEYRVTFDYSDPDGDVGSGIRTFGVFSPSGDGGMQDFFMTYVGLSSDGFNGTAAFRPCILFTGSDTHLTITVTLFDKSGFESNTLQVVIPRS